jgi:carbonic anhydrase
LSIRASMLGHAILLLAASAAHAQGRPAALSDSRPKPALAPGAATAAAAVVEPAGKHEPPDALRQRLAERLSSKSEPIGATPAKAAGKPPPARASSKAAGAPKPRPPASIHWAYGGEGAPEHWGELKPDFRLCSIGTRQSPVDIRDGIRVDLAPIKFDYRHSGFAVLDNGHTVQVNIEPGNMLEVMGRRYELVQFHFHRPSEERINGRQFDMSAHLVHKDAEGRLAVLAVLLERGIDQPLVQAVWNNLPLEKMEPLKAQGLLDPGQLLPEDRGYYTYMGSLTTPPCSEGVLWMVMRQPVQLSGQQIEVFARLYPMNARPVQQGSGRLIKQSR